MSGGLVLGLEHLLWRNCSGAIYSCRCLCLAPKDDFVIATPLAFVIRSILMQECELPYRSVAPHLFPRTLRFSLVALLLEHAAIV
jgi:hypothetical protein